MSAWKPTITPRLVITLAAGAVVSFLVAVGACAQPKATSSESVEVEEESVSDQLWPVARKTVEPTGASDEQPSVPRSDDAVTVAVISDLNGSYGSTDYREAVHDSIGWIRDELRPDLVVSTGDMVAGQKRGLDYDAMWQGFHDSVTRPLRKAQIPLAPTPGNHDASAGSVYIDERATFVRQWRRHRPDVDFVDDRFFPLHYAFRKGPALFVSLDATITGPIDRHQREWLDQVLTEQADAPVKVVYGHVPLYPFSRERADETLADDALEALLRRHDVDVMLSGHHHAYYPGRRGDLRVVSMACLGAGPRTLVGSNHESRRSVAVLRIDADEGITVDAYQPGGDKIARRSLPPHLNHGSQRIWRDDL